MQKGQRWDNRRAKLRLDDRLPPEWHLSRRNMTSTFCLPIANSPVKLGQSQIEEVVSSSLVIALARNVRNRSQAHGPLNGKRGWKADIANRQPTGHDAHVKTPRKRITPWQMFAGLLASNAFFLLGALLLDNPPNNPAFYFLLSVTILPAALFAWLHYSYP